VTERIVEPRLGRYTGTEVAPPMAELTAVERRGLVAAGITLAATTLLFLLAVVPSWGILRTPGESVLHSAFFRGLITAILFFFLAPGLAYGIATGSIRSDKDVVRQMTAAMGSLASYIVLVFFAAQFVYSFGYSNLGLVLAVRGAELLEGIGLTGVPLMIGFVLMSAFINLFMGSASAKWAIMAPVFVPMFMLLGYHPGLTQAVFRIGDSVTNVVTPMMSYFALIVAFAQKYDPRSGLGTLISTMLPYTLLFGLLWTLLLVGWMLLGLPVGPDGPLQYVAGS